MDTDLKMITAAVLRKFSTKEFMFRWGPQSFYNSGSQADTA